MTTPLLVLGEKPEALRSLSPSRRPIVGAAGAKGKSPPPKSASPPPQIVGPLMTHRRKGFLLGDVQLEGQATVTEHRISFQSNSGLCSFSRPLKLTGRHFAPGDIVMFRPLVCAQPDDGIVVEIRDDTGSVLKVENITVLHGDKLRDGRIQIAFSKNVEFISLHITPIRNKTDDITVTEIKCKIEELSGNVLHTNKIID